MTWKCPNCGFEANEDGCADCAGGCGHLRCPARLVLRGGAGKALTMGLTTLVGRRLLEPVVGDEARFASDVQFEVVKEGSLGHWEVRPGPGAANATCLNGDPLGGPSRALQDGDVLSIGRDKAKLTVRFPD